MFAIKTTLCLLTQLLYSCKADCVCDEYYPIYHLAPPHGWMNDPNGFSEYRNEYHLFYQYNPNSSQAPGIAHWGHAKSNDLFHWKHLPIAMYPDKDYDKGGVFSGSAIIENDVMYFYYTANINYPNGNPDHTNRQALAYSADGVNVTKYSGNPIIRADEHQPNIRDPKVWKHEDIYYMVLGNSFNNGTRGRVLLYSSDDRITWKQVSILAESDGSLGYMWECPDFFELNGKWILLFSPQGIPAQGDKYKNLYQLGYLVGYFSYETLLFTVTSKFRELDHGHDIYASQTMEDKSGLRIMVAWLDMWEQVYPERNDGWTGQMTIPRNLYLTQDQRLIQKPVREIMTIRSGLLYSGQAVGGTSVKLRDNAGEIKITASMFEDFELLIRGGNTTVTITYNCEQGTITLDRGGSDGVRRTEWRPDGILQMQIFVDRSSIEMFCGEGAITFSSRYFPEGQVSVKLGQNSTADHMSVYCIEHTVPEPDQSC